VQEADFPEFSRKAVIKHKKAVLCSAISPDRKVIATGSADTCIRITDWGALLLEGGSEGGSSSTKDACMEVYHDHASVVNTLQFHPFTSVLCSGASDGKIHLFKVKQQADEPQSSSSSSSKSKSSSSKSSTSRDSKRKNFAAKTLSCDGFAVRSVGFHPSGDFLLAGSDDIMPRLFDVNTGTAYVSADAKRFHAKAITSVTYEHNGNCYATSSEDGTIKMWDTGTVVVCVCVYSAVYSIYILCVCVCV
jgi:cleavage stimulation factor subunit 1